MNIKLRLVMNFFQFCLGIWLIHLRVHGQTFGPIEGGSIGLSIGRTYGSMAGRLFMPALLGIIAEIF
jgi:NHS family xanthosine MFS transporter